jgi:hypothetical protein
MRTALFLWIALACAACGDDDGDGMMMERDAGLPVLTPVSAQPIVALEGHETMVIDIFDPAGEANFDGATVTKEIAASPIDVLESVCTPTRCAARLRVRDTRANMGRPFPQPIDGIQAFLLVASASSRYRAAVNVRPLDTISNSGGSATVQGPQIASSIDIAAGAMFGAAPTGAPVRWVVFGGGRIGGTIDFSPPADGPRVGGGNGGLAGAIGFGSAPGLPGLGGAGGGGGGTSIDGDAGTAADGTADGGGAGGTGDGDVYASCVDDFGANLCGGSGGGGATGAGGHGGGALLIASLGPLDVTGASIRISGGAGTDGGGGGGGGSFVIAAPSLTGFPLDLDVSGGAGAMAGTARGGDGAAGRARLDAPVPAPAGYLAGPSVDLAGFSQITREEVLTLRGRGDAEARIAVRIVDTPTEFTTTVGADGTYAVEVTLRPGLNRLSVVQTDSMGRRARSWCGTNIEFGMVGPLATAVGATVDVVYLP